MFNKLKLGLLITILGASLTYAARPFSVEDAGVVEEGVEMETSYSGSTAGDSLSTETGFVLNFAVIENLHVGIEKGFTSEIVRGGKDQPWGNGDLVISAKYALPDDQSVKFSRSDTSGDEKNGFGNEFIEYGIVFAKEKKKGTSTIYTNLGYNFYDRQEWYKEDVKNNWFLGVGLLYPLKNNLALCFEVNKTIVQGDYLDNLDGYVNGMVGLVWTVNDIPIDISYTSQPDVKDYTFAIGTALAI
jgi:hypothetical protein